MEEIGDFLYIGLYKTEIMLDKEENKIFVQ
jgi:hypothetical protein